MKTKKLLIQIFLVLAALVVAALISHLTQGVSFLRWLTWGESIGFDLNSLDLAIIDIRFAFKMEVNVLQVILVTAALLLSRKVR